MTAEKTATPGITIIDMGVGGMTCDDCIGHVTEALESVSGVTSAEVSLEDRSAVVEAETDVDSAALASAVRDSGYNVFERGRSSR